MGLEVDDKLVLGRRLHRQFGRLFGFETRGSQAV